MNLHFNFFQNVIEIRKCITAYEELSTGIDELTQQRLRRWRAINEWKRLFPQLVCF